MQHSRQHCNIFRILWTLHHVLSSYLLFMKKNERCFVSVLIAVRIPLIFVSRSDLRTLFLFDPNSCLMYGLTVKDSLMSRDWIVP